MVFSRKLDASQIRDALAQIMKEIREFHGLRQILA